MEPPTYFQVTMVKGIFRSMQADHRFRSLPSGVTELTGHFRDCGAAPHPRANGRGALSAPLHDDTEPRTQCRHSTAR